MDSRSLRLDTRSPHGGSDSDSEVEALTFAVFAGGLDSIVREMTITMARTSRSSILSDGYDFSNALFDGQLRMVNQGHNFPVHVGAMIDAGKAVRDYFGDDVHPGDLIYCNDPLYDGSHLPDMTLYKPVFIDDELAFWAANKAHMMDTGGPVAGGYNPYAKDIYAEGLRISPVKIYERGVPRSDVIDLLATNVRLPRSLRGDLRAQVAVVNTAATRLEALAARFDALQRRRLTTEVLDRAERIMRAEIAKIPDGTYEGSGIIEDYGHGRGDTLIASLVTVAGEQMTIGLDAPPQVDSYFNSYGPNTKSMIYFAILAFVRPDMPHNEGLYRQLSVDLGPTGTTVNAVPPAACAQGTGSMADAIWDSMAEALSKALPTRGRGSWGRPYCVIFTGHKPGSGEDWADYSQGGGMGGGGASARTDGWDGIGWVNAGGACHYGDAEALELKEPIRVWRHELRVDSAGPGARRGGSGTIHEVEVLADVSMTVISEGTKHPPPGRCGAPAGPDPSRVHAKWLLTPEGHLEEIRPQTVTTVRVGSRIVSHTAGGGGVGKATDREPELVEQDVRAGITSVEGARENYRVILDAESGRLDADATAQLRRQ